jgi:hypothetical protein
VCTDDIDTAIADLEAKGHVLAFRAGVGSGGDVAYMDGGPDKPRMTELIEFTPGMDAGFTAMWQASRDRDGADPIRPFGAGPAADVR